jgi:hypothetical protein
LVPDVSFFRSVLPVHRHHAGAAETEVVLKRDPSALDLSLLCFATQLPDQLGALG